ncbi:autotransporter domain-containing protein [Neorhizobium petrolearium]|uniref:Autotransporter outer membrane beta-barrel domain-containing protein n=1 Tax=Neorhizobium petrolearium TaxID=515361 RepID=A0ABY8LX24_9HYPH|nr:autotransporter domain-containing protein [Neorhizobium petrolearium]MCC2610996.1 autotransporter outer membrane beta-barrel domain-containing protein [Neorhizobium petrolearium]WGI66216.1 autotransporter outer membrane beta-barrel domain-containing protein [Neorhizobium petrolearium]
MSARTWTLLASTALVNCLAGLVANAPASAQSVTTSGEVNPSPATSPVWNVGGELHVGDVGVGSLVLEGGGVVNNTSASVGNQAGSSGMATVIGHGSTWTNNGYVSIGYFGSGTLNIEGGGTVNTTYGYIGANSGSTGTTIVTGNGSTWHNTGSLTIGQSGNGTLSIEDGGVVDNTIGYVGFSPHSIGRVTVVGAGSTWSNSQDLYVGHFGYGTLDIEAGGTVNNKYGYIGAKSGSTGIATVTGTGSTWTMVDDLAVGDGGAGTLSVEAAGQVRSGFGYVGTGSGAEGRVTVTGTGSQWTAAHSLFVGDAGGSGWLLIADGGSVANGYAVIGSGTGTGTDGTVIVTGAHSKWDNLGDLNIGNSGTGRLSVEDGGSVVTGWGSFVGYGVGAVGTAAVSGAGSSWSSALNLSVGVFGNGELAVTNGGRISSYGGFIGDFAGSSGAITISGIGSSWNDAADVTIGNNGAGTLSVEDGGQVLNALGFIGKETGATGTATVTGIGSTWTNSADLTIGGSGTGSLTIAHGGAVINKDAFIARHSGGAGEVVVQGKETTWTGERIFVGLVGTGKLTITQGGTVSSALGILGWNSGSNGSATVTGAGSTWINSTDLAIGDLGYGTLTIEQDGKVSAGGAITLGAQAGSIGTLNIGAAAGNAAVAAGTLDVASLAFGAGTGTLVFNHSGLADGSSVKFAADIGGHGTILHESGDTILGGNGSHFTGVTEVTGGRLTVADRFGGSASVRGGQLLVNGSFGGDVTASDMGTVTGTGTIDGDLSLSNGGILLGAQGTMLSIGGDLDLDDGSIIDVALGGTLTSALFDIGGNLTLDGTLAVADQGGFGAGVYRLFDYAGSLTDHGLGIGPTPAGIVADDLRIQTAVSGQVNLISTAGAELGFWDGANAALHDNGAVDGGSGVWSADGRNWTSGDGAFNGSFKPNPTFAIFQGPSGAVTVDNSAGAVGVTGMQFASDGYGIAGDTVTLLGINGESIIRVGDGGATDSGMAAGISASLGGVSRLVKTGAGSLVLSGKNTYTGGTRIASGTLWLSSDANLGATSGGLIFDGGTLATATGFNSNRTITLDDIGRFDVFGDRELALSGAISGAGGIEKSGTGTLKLAGNNLYEGNTLVRAGTLTGSADAIRGSIGNAGAVVFEQDADAAFAGDIAGLGGDRGEMIKRGAGTLILTGVSLLDWDIEEGGMVSTTDRFAGDLDLAQGTGFTFDQIYDGTYDGAISGSGTVSFLGGGRIALTGDNAAFTGFSEVSDTTLIVNEALGGSALIGNGGRLQGSGTIGSGDGSTVTLAPGSTLAPGNSIGTLTVDGDLVLDVGSRYEVEVAPGGKDTDLIKVTGSATLNGGTVVHIGMTGAYDPAATYTIITADEGVSGAFDAVTSAFAFLDPKLGYSTNNVTLMLSRNDIDFAQAAVTRNQIAAAQGADSLTFGNDLYDAIVQLDETTARAAFDQISGEIHASVTTGLIEDSRHIRSAANDRLRAAFQGVAASTDPVIAYGADGLAPVPASADAGIAVWGSGFGSWGSTDENGNAAHLDRSVGGFVGGADAMLTDAWRVGFLAGYSQSSSSTNDRASSSSGDNYHVGFYAGSRSGDFAFRSGLAYTWNDIETDRSVGFTGFADSLGANYNAATFQAFGEFAYGMETKVARLEPFVNLAHVRVGSDGYRETGGAAALTSSSLTTDTTFTTLGLRAENKVAIGRMQIGITGMLGWRRAFGDTTPTVTHAFAGSDAFTVAGNPIARDAAVVEAGIDVDVAPGANLTIAYQGQIANGARDHGFTAKLGVKF